MRMVRSKLALLLVSMGITLTATLFAVTGSGTTVGGRLKENFKSRFQILKLRAESPKERVPSTNASKRQQNDAERRYQVVEKQVIYNAKLGVSLPCVVKAANGDLLVQFNTGKDCWPGSTAYLVRSTDSGKNWGDPVKLIEPRRRGGAIHTNVGITLLRNGDLILPLADVKVQDGWKGFPNPKHSGHEYAKTQVILSHDNGKTWSELIAANGGLPWSAPHGRLVEMPDGRLLLPLWASDIASGPVEFGKDAYAGYLVSRDGGRTWGEFHKMGSFGEISLVLLKDNKTMLASLKQHPSRLTHVIRSDDGGKTWNQPKHFGVQVKNAILHLSPAGIPLILGSPVEAGENRPGCVYYSLDKGETWKEGVRLIEPISPKYPMAYGVSAVNLRDGRMLVTFYGYDPAKMETGDSPWSTTTSYLASNVVLEQ